MDWLIKKARYMACANLDKIPVEDCVFELIQLLVSDPAITAEEESVYGLIKRWSSVQVASREVHEQCALLLSNCVDWSKVDLDLLLKSGFVDDFHELSVNLRILLNERRKLCFACHLNASHQKCKWQCVMNGRGVRCPEPCNKDLWIALTNHTLRKSTEVPAFVVRRKDTDKFFIECFRSGEFVTIDDVPGSVLQLRKYQGYRVCSVGKYQLFLNMWKCTF